MVDGTEQAKAFAATTGLGEFRPTHVSHKQVEAYPIAAAEFEEDGSGRVAIDHPTRGSVIVPVPMGFRRGAGAVREGDLLVRYTPTRSEPYGYLSHSPREVFEDGYREIGVTGLLMTAENPTGWKLEDLASRIIAEVLAKTVKLDAMIACETDPAKLDVLHEVRGNNLRVIGCARGIRTSQLATMKLFDAFGPDQGLTGTPRIGSAPMRFEGAASVRVEQPAAA